MQPTVKLKSSYTTRLLDDLADPWLRALAALAVILLVVGAIGVTLAWREAQTAAPLPVIILATATPAPAQPTVAALPPQLPALWDYQDASTATLVDARRLACVVGTADAGRWSLVALDRCDSPARVWLAAVNVPAGVAVASRADLTPRTAVPALAIEPQYGVSRYQPAAEQPAEPEVAAPEATALPPIYDFGVNRPPTPAPGEPGFKESFQESSCSAAITYLPGHRCYSK